MFVGRDSSHTIKYSTIKGEKHTPKRISSFPAHFLSAQMGIKHADGNQRKHLLKFNTSTSLNFSTKKFGAIINLWRELHCNRTANLTPEFGPNPSESFLSKCPVLIRKNLIPITVIKGWSVRLIKTPKRSDEYRK